MSRWPTDVPMISIVAADKEGLKAARLRNHHLRGSSAINYEADIILILNEKYNIVAKVNIEFNPYQAQRFREWVILSDREEPRWPEHGRPGVPEALRVLMLRRQWADRAGEAHRGAPLQRLTDTRGRESRGHAGLRMSARARKRSRCRPIAQAIGMGRNEPSRPDISRKLLELIAQAIGIERNEPPRPDFGRKPLELIAQAIGMGRIEPSRPDISRKPPEPIARAIGIERNEPAQASVGLNFPQTSR